MNKKIMPLLLALCLLLNMISLSGMALAAEGDSKVTYMVNDTGSLLAALAEIAEQPVSATEYEIVVTDSFFLTQSITFPKNKNITLCGNSSSPHTIYAGEDLKKNGGNMFVVPQYDSLSEHIIIIHKLILNAQQDTQVKKNLRIIWVLDNARLMLAAGTTLQGGYVGGATNSGGALRAEPNSIIQAINANFRDNVADPASGTGGGAVYLNCAAGYFHECNFTKNKAHSGGAIYFFGGDRTRTINNQNIKGMPLVIDHCGFGSGDNRNTADQRGGAIHCHGDAVIYDTWITDQECNQTSGTVPLSHFPPGGVVSAGGLCYYGGSLLRYGVRICQEELDAAAKAGSIMLCSGGSTGQPSFTTMRITRRF